MAKRDDEDMRGDTVSEQWIVSEKNPAAVALGRLGGRKGGPARAAKLTPQRRQEIAKRAAAARWQSRPETLVSE